MALRVAFELGGYIYLYEYMHFHLFSVLHELFSWCHWCCSLVFKIITVALVTFMFSFFVLFCLIMLVYQYKSHITPVLITRYQINTWSSQPKYGLFLKSEEKCLKRVGDSKLVYYLLSSLCNEGADTLFFFLLPHCHLFYLSLCWYIFRLLICVYL